MSFIRRLSETLSSAFYAQKGTTDPTEEERALEELRPRIADIISEDVVLKDDFYLLRWLKSYDFKVGRAEKAIRDAVKWRCENNVALLVTEDFDSDLAKELPMYMDSCTKNDVPVLSTIFVSLSKYDKARVVRHFIQAYAKFESILVKHYRREYDEMCARQERRVAITADVIVGGIVLFDAGQLGFKELASSVALQICMEGAKICANYFPCLVNSSYCFKTTKFFEYCNKVMKPILALAGIKMKVFDGNEANWKPAVLELVHVDELLQEWGGNKVHQN